MNNLKYAVSGLLSIILLPLGMHSVAQPAAFSDCQAIQDRQARYDCYDALETVSGLERESDPAVTASTPAPGIQQSAAVHAQENPSEHIPQRAQEEDERSLFSRIFRRDSDNEPAETQANAARVSTSQTALADFGNSPGATRVIDGADGEFELIDTVADLDQPAPNVWIITLQSGQKWQQMASKRYNLEEGDEVRIYPTRWGNNYRLTSEKAGGFIQVKRTR